MHYNSKGIAALLAGGISITVSLVMALAAELTVNVHMILFVIILLVSFASAYYTLEVVYFRKIRQLDELIGENADPRKAGADESRRVDIVGKMTAHITALTREKQQEIDQLRKLETFRRNFIADISHELKTPIFAAQGFVHTLLDGAVDEKAVRKKFLKKAAKSLDALDLLVQDLLTLSNIETGQIRMHFEEIDLFALTTDVFDQFKGKSNKKEIELKIDGPVRKVPVYADWQRISQVMTNLISNAILYSGDEGEVIVSFAVKKKSVVVKVRDYGEGIAQEHIRHIFERFYRVDKSRSREKGGTGLGLAIVKHILEGHHSSPQVESSPGKGSTFSFKLPRFPDDKIENSEHDEPAIE